MSFGGFLGLGHYRRPSGALKYNPRLNGLETGATEAQPRDAPALARRPGRIRDWEQQTYAH